MTASNPALEPQSYFISTPYIDAYQHDWEEEDHPKLDFDAFVQKMRSQAYSWGEQSVGRATLMGTPPALHEDEFVLAFGEHGGKKYVAVRTVEDGISVTEVEAIPDEWDVT